MIGKECKAVFIARDTGSNLRFSSDSGNSRVIPAKSTYLRIVQPSPSWSGNGHGTHCAGIIGSHKCGVSGLSNSSPSGSWVPMEVVPWLMSFVVIYGPLNRLQKCLLLPRPSSLPPERHHTEAPSLISTGGGYSWSLNDAVNKAIESGLDFAVASGDDNKDAYSYSPTSAGKAITISASALGDDRAYFSNHGECISVFVPSECLDSVS